VAVDTQLKRPGDDRRKTKDWDWVDKVATTEETNEPRKKNKRTATKRILNDWQRNDKNKGLEFTEDLFTLVFMFFLLGRRLDEDIITPFFFIIFTKI
jgi:hypothetical protein